MALSGTMRRFLYLGEWGKYPVPAADCISASFLSALGMVAIDQFVPAQGAAVVGHFAAALGVAVLSTAWIRWIVKRGAGSKQFW